MGIVQVFLRNTLNLLAHCSREQQRAMFLWNTFENGVEVLLEAHRKHFVGFVKDKVTHIVKHSHLLTHHQIYQSAWSSHYYIHPMLQGTNLRLDICTAIYSQYANLRHIFCKALQVVCNLQAQLACRTQDKHRWKLSTHLSVHHLQQRQSVGGSLTGSRLRQSH